MKPIIRVQGVCKQYHIGAERVMHGTLREQLTYSLRSSLRRVKNANSSSTNADKSFWALDDVSFDVMPGEVVGIIGRNGAGKSTLLKILSRITEPTSGRIELYGRIGSLLEVGTGFHPELSGRENIYLNGAILGMQRSEINRKFDEIVDFAEVERFLDTPVKRYSSGMYTRLAFAVAAHLEPEVLIIDEVLAVGDAQFQRKCLGKMGDVARGGRTVLFVSHSLGSLASLCPRAILLVQGRKHSDGSSADVINEYIALGRETNGEQVWADAASAPGNEKVRLVAVRIISGGEVTSDVNIDQDVTVDLEFYNACPNLRLTSSIHLLDRIGTGVLASANMHSANLGRDEWFNKPHPVGFYRTSCTIPGNFLNEGRYGINAFVLSDVTNIEASAEEVISFTVHDTGAMRQEYGGGWLGVVRPKLLWQTESLPAPRASYGEEAAQLELKEA